MTIQNKITNIIMFALETNKEIKLDDNLHSVHNADSLDKVEILMAMEEEFGIEISDEQADTTITLQGLIHLVTDHAA